MDESARNTDDSGRSHNPHDVPLTEDQIAQLEQDTARYGDALEHIRQYKETIQQETTEGEPPKAHRPLDKLDVVLQRLPDAARNSGIPKENWQTINETAQQLRDLFNQVHANIDEGTDPDYEAVADDIDRGIETLTSVQSAKAE